ncbi:peptidase M20 [Pullulanibacillus camelliae]|uniref:Peptidase M20 n=1 Tax=Pullulanibacillus camelliae TaxID=1707096 RepID=A0A8J2YIK4_9BACL|nr:M20 family metallopeptidase [Pullulanibacillus camelliae]GGE45092.1 peptidase M20 [Pullulanibacillus camelliae]
MDTLYTFLKEREDQLLQTLKALVELESPSREKRLTDKTGKFIADTFRELTGGSTSVIPNQTYGNHIKGEWGSGEEQILVLAHFDTVWPKGELERMPFRIEAGKAYGPGIFDMKGGLVQGIYALHALTQLQRSVKSRVVFLFNSDEELGSPTSRQLIEDEAKKSKFVLVLEPAMSEKGALKTARKGVGMFNLEVTGKPTHSGIDPEKGKSAIQEMAEQISYLHGLTNYDKGTTINVGRVKGGTTRNVVAAHADAEIDLRVTTLQEYRRVSPLIESIKPHMKGTSLSITGGMNRPPLERTDQVVHMFKKAQTIAKEKLNYQLIEKATGGGSDGNFTAPFTPTLDGLGAVGDGAHAKHEHLIISEMPIRSALVALLIEELSQ